MTDRSIRSDVALVRQLWLTDGRRLIGRAFKWLLALGTVGAIVSTGVGAWRFSHLIFQEALEAPAAPGPLFDHATVTDIGVDSVVLRKDAGATPSLTRDGVMGIRWDGGYGRLGSILAQAGDLVTREFTPSVGQLVVGQAVTVDGMVYYGDPRSDHGIDFETVSVPGPLGPLESWYVPGSGSTWTIYIHGKGADRIEALRLLPTTVAAGHPALVMRYRNDPGAPYTGRYAYGAAEYGDLQAAVRWAVDRGADSIVLVGYSMGGAIAAQFVHESPFASRVVGLVLDAPMLHLGRAIDIEAANRGVPAPLAAVAKTTAALRFGISWSELDYLTKLRESELPMLVFHGTEDDVVPIELSRSLESAAPRLVQLHEVPGAGHVQSWNVDPPRYEELVRVFLAGLTQGTAS